MKLHNIAIFGTMAATLLTGCEMKEELWPDKDKNGKSLGAAILKVSVKKPLSQTRTDVPTDNFPISIVGKSEDVAGITKDYEKASEMPEKIQLPIGTYDVISHSPFELEQQMDKPYYEGITEMEIQYKFSTQADVICKQKNSHIEIVYGDDFKANFSSWTITVDDGQDKNLTFTSEKQDNNGKYWYFGEKTVKSITVNVRGTTTDGNSVSESRTFIKANATGGYDNINEFFEGGDAITIQMGAVQASTGFVTGVTINANVVFDDHSESVEIPVYEETAQAIAITDNNTGYLQNGVTVTPESAPSNVSLLVTAPEGIKNAYVKITSDNSTFATVLTSVDSGISTGEGIDFVSTNFALGNFTRPNAGDTSYTFSLAGLMSMLQSHQGTHIFTLKVVDSANQTKAATLRVISTKEEEGGNEGNSGSNMPTLQMPADVTMPVAETETTTRRADAVINAPNGIKTMIVKVIAGSIDFEDALSLLTEPDSDYIIDFINGTDLVGNTQVHGLLNSLKDEDAPEILMPQQGDTTYTFAIGDFFKFIGWTGSNTTPHEFHITLTDNNGNRVSGVFKITLTE